MKLVWCRQKQQLCQFVLGEGVYNHDNQVKLGLNSKTNKK